MYLLIDSSEYNSIHLALFNEKKIEHKIYSVQNREILNCIQKLVKTPKALNGIMVVVGTGSFTSTRLSCVVANTFAYVQQIPLLAIKKQEVDNVQKLIPKLLKQKSGNYISATYSGEPNIGKKA